VAVETVEIASRRQLVSVARHPGLVPALVVARRVMRSALIWGAVFGLVTWVEVSSFAKEYPTLADRARAAATYGSNVGLQAIFGPVHHIGTVAGYTAFHLIVAGLIGAVWGLLAGTRLVRGEEEAGRWESLLAGQTTPRRAAAGAVAGLGFGLLTLWAVTAAIAVVVGRSGDADFTVSASLFAALAMVAGAAIFLAVGAMCSQLAATRRQAAALAAGTFGVVYLMRLVAYSSTSLRWLRWASPLGWIDELRPLTASRPLPLIPIVGTIVVLVVLAIFLAGRRDVGAGILPANDTAAPRTGLLNGPLGLAFRLDRRTVAGWIVGMAAGGLVVGLITESAAVAWENQNGGFLQRLGGASGGAIYLGIAFLMVVLLVATAAAGQVVATREEEAEGFLDHLLARPVARVSWLGGRVVVSAAALVLIGVVAGLSTWVGAAITGAGLSMPTLLAAGLNVVPVAIVVLGIGTLVHGFAPRFAGAVAYGLVAWSFFVEVVGASVGASHWLLDTSIFHHIARAPADAVHWDSAAVLVVVGIIAAAAGIWRLARRDLAGT
jgi:polyether ionophore transport system permease protein